MKNAKSYFLQLAVALQRRTDWLVWPFLALVTVVTWQVRHHFFFWDTMQLGAQHALFFHNNGFATFLLPDAMDSGHPPAFGFYLALMWSVLGKSLTVSHLAMLPFLWGIVWQAWRLGERQFGTVGAVSFLLMLLGNPIMASQGILVSPDVALVCFFLMAVNAILSENNKLLAVANLGLAMISLRGMMVVAALFAFDFLRRSPIQWRHFGRTLVPFLPAGMAAAAFLGYHFFEKGWLGYHAGSAWADAFQKVDFQGFVKNCLIYIWRLCDFGFAAILGTAAFLTARFFRKTNASTDFPQYASTRQFLLLFWLLFIVISPSLLLHKGLLAHRYLLPIYVSLTLLCVKLVSELRAFNRQILIYAALFLAMILGHFIVYPQPIATGWDSTLAHVPYYRLRREMLQFIDNQKIDYQTIGTSFPNQRSFEETDLDTLRPKMQLAPLDFDRNAYIFYSNVMNDFDQRQLETLEKDWEKVKILRGGQVVVVLYKKRAMAPQ